MQLRPGSGAGEAPEAANPDPPAPSLKEIRHYFTLYGVCLLLPTATSSTHHTCFYLISRLALFIDVRLAISCRFAFITARLLMFRHIRLVELLACFLHP